MMLLYEPLISNTGTELEEVKKEWMILNCRVRLDGLTVANPFKTSSMRN